MALAALHVLEKPDVTPDAVLATNLSTSRMIDDVAGLAGARVVRVPVGEANVAEVMGATGAILGGEGNGGVMWPPVVCVRDSLTAMALILEMLAQREQSISQVVNRIPRYAIAKAKVSISDDRLASEFVSRITDRFTGGRIDLQDGVRVDWTDRWVHVRLSNTEPILRFIAEARDEQGALDLINQVRETLDQGTKTVV